MMHLKSHRGEKSNKCNQCDYGSYLASDLRKHLKMHSGEKLKKNCPVFVIALPVEDILIQLQSGTEIDEVARKGMKMKGSEMKGSEMKGMEMKKSTFPFYEWVANPKQEK